MISRTRLVVAIALSSFLPTFGCSSGDDAEPAAPTTATISTTVPADDGSPIDERGVDNTIPAEITPEMAEFLALICTLPQEQPDVTEVQGAMATAIAVVRRGAEMLGESEGLDTADWPRIADEFESFVATQTPEQLLSPDESVEAVSAFGTALSEVLETRVGPCPEI